MTRYYKMATLIISSVYIAVIGIVHLIYTRLISNTEIQLVYYPVISFFSGIITFIMIFKLVKLYDKHRHLLDKLRQKIFKFRFERRNPKFTIEFEYSHFLVNSYKITICDKIQNIFYEIQHGNISFDQSPVGSEEYLNAIAAAQNCPSFMEYWNNHKDDNERMKKCLKKINILYKNRGIKFSYRTAENYQCKRIFIKDKKNETTLSGISNSINRDYIGSIAFLYKIKEQDLLEIIQQSFYSKYSDHWWEIVGAYSGEEEYAQNDWEWDY